MSTTLHSRFDLDFRPKSYFDGSASLLANISGDWRRERIREALRNGEGTDVPEALFGSALPEALRQVLGRIHPSCMGGEYLPELLEGEVEIARVRLKSANADVICIRARQEGDDIVYRVLDEYESWERGACKLEPARSSQPLTLRELLRLINTADNGESYGVEFGAKGILGPLYFSIWEAQEGLKSMLDFVRVGSEFYPELEDCCDEGVSLWRDTFEAHRTDGKDEPGAVKALGGRPW
ncbi:MAG: hypothetical protein ACI9K5_004188 [Gammaproteobacteria bacterium]|jgi:hypothetical protein